LTKSSADESDGIGNEINIRVTFDGEKQRIGGKFKMTLQANITHNYSLKLKMISKTTHSDEEIISWIEFTCTKNGVPELAKDILFHFRSRLTRCLGRALPRNKVIELSTPLWARATHEERRQVVIHEVCHIIADNKHGFGIKAHGPEWKRCMALAGAPADRLHQIDRTGLRRQYVKYEAGCACRVLWIGHVRASHVRKGQISCTRCGSAMTLTGKTFRPQN
jgi:SprT protein